jgi:quercetin dioxygenase-like cupin family protein
MAPAHHSAVDRYAEITTYGVAPEHQQAILDALVAETTRWVSHQPGFLAVNDYPSADGIRVVHSVAWRTVQDWDNAQHSPEQPILWARMQAIPGTTLMDTHGYTTAHTVQGPVEPLFTRPWSADVLVSPHALVAGERQVIIVPGSQTNQTMSVVGVIDLPQCGPPLHVHTLEDETFHVLEGDYAIQVGEQLVRAAPGATVFGPRHHPHGYRYLGESGVGRLLAIFTPAGLEDLFLAFDAWALAGKQPTLEEFSELAGRFQVKVLG